MMMCQSCIGSVQSQKRRMGLLLWLSVWVGSSLVSFGAYTPAVAEELVIPESAVEAATESSASVPVEPTVVEPDMITPALDRAPDVIVPPSVADPQGPAPSDPYIDTQDYSIGATEPYTPPEQIVINDRASGCQASLDAGQAIAASLCDAPATPPRDHAIAPALEQPSAWVDRWASSSPVQENPSPSPISTQTVQNSLQQYTVAPPRNLVLKPITGANPLRWILNGERMIFPLAIPVDITSAFGWRVHPLSGELRFHSGTDLGAPMGTPVLAAYSGRVSLAEMLGGYGLSILLDHNQGKEETRYAHLSEVFVKPGQWVQQGTVIGLVGSTGNSTGPHLHFETLQATPDGMVAVDPGVELQTTLAQLAQALQTARLEAPPKISKANLNLDEGS